MRGGYGTIGNRAARELALKPATRRRVRFLAGFGAYFIALAWLWDTPVVFPLKSFVVLLHEVSHGIVAVATGGTIESIRITADEGGWCRCGGGSAFLTLSAGYLGSLGWGALILEAAERGRRWTRTALVVIGGGVLLLTLAYVRGVFGLVFGVAFGAALLTAARWLGPRTRALLLTALGLTSCLYAILDIKSDILDRPGLPSDATLLAQLTGIPAWGWGVVWIGAAVWFAWWRLRRTWSAL